jgi:hypothetical protein
MGHRAAVHKHPLHQQATTVHSQTSISVGHEDLLDLVETSDISTKPGGPPLHKTQTVTNLHAEYT